jgi:predicted Ser/Thr protein kinase
MKAGVTKEQLVKSLGETLSLTREGISHLELKDKDTVIIHWNHGYQREVNIACDSGLAIIKDVAKSIDY